MIRRVVAAALAGLFLAFSVVMPARAFWPVAVLAEPVLVGASNTAYLTGALSGIVGLVGMYLEIEDATTQDKVRIPVKDGAAAEPPAPVAPATASAQPSTVYTVQILGGSASTPGEACSIAATHCSQSGCVVSSSTATSCTLVWKAEFGGGPAGTYDIVSAPGPGVCGAGYVVSGGTCQLTNARQAAPDKKCDLKFSGSGSGSRYMYYDDADCPSGPTVDNSKMVPGMRLDGKVVWMAGTDAYGQKVVWQVLVDDSGGKVVLEKWRQVETGGNSAVEKTTYNVDRTTGTVTSAGQVTSAGTISAPSASTVPTTTTTAPTAADTPTATTDPTKQVFQFPTDYARTGEAASAATTVKTSIDALAPKIDQIHTDLTTVGNAPADPALPGAQAFSDAFFKGTFDGLLAWRLPAHSSSCPSLTLDYNMWGSQQHHVMDAQCTIAEQQRSNINIFMIVVWTLAALFIALEA